MLLGLCRGYAGLLGLGCQVESACGLLSVCNRFFLIVGSANFQGCSWVAEVVFVVGFVDSRGCGFFLEEKILVAWIGWKGIPRPGGPIIPKGAHRAKRICFFGEEILLAVIGWKRLKLPGGPIMAKGSKRAKRISLMG